MGIWEIEIEMPMLPEKKFHIQAYLLFKNSVFLHVKIMLRCHVHSFLQCIVNTQLLWILWYVMIVFFMAYENRKPNVVNLGGRLATFSVFVFNVFFFALRK